RIDARWQTPGCFLITARDERRLLQHLPRDVATVAMCAVREIRRAVREAIGRFRRNFVRRLPASALRFRWPWRSS
ncbi:MAG TPA: hypothetical protein VNG89_03720, partial [Vicinamibacterales bacterium]|nr:hypothetical protein [Vicinamibacterales bacterium]